MNYRYYKTLYWQNPETEILSDSLSEHDFYYRFYYESKLGIEVGERFLNNGFDKVYYKGNNLPAIYSYHELTFKHTDAFDIVEPILKSTILVKTYKKGVFAGAIIVNINSNYDEKKICLFDEHFELNEYREFSSFKDEKAGKQRIFIPSIWKLLEDDL
jgi:hypothetical protein